jgi:hypothetical protein
MLWCRRWSPLNNRPHRPHSPPVYTRARAAGGELERARFVEGGLRFIDGRAFSAFPGRIRCRAFSHRPALSPHRVPRRFPPLEGPDPRGSLRDVRYYIYIYIYIYEIAQFRFDDPLTFSKSRDFDFTTLETALYQLLRNRPIST